MTTFRTRGKGGDRTVYPIRKRTTSSPSGFGTSDLWMKRRVPLNNVETAVITTAELKSLRQPLIEYADISHKNGVEYLGIVTPDLRLVELPAKRFNSLEHRGIRITSDMIPILIKNGGVMWHSHVYHGVPSSEDIALVKKMDDILKREGVRFTLITTGVNGVSAYVGIKYHYSAMSIDENGYPKIIRMTS